jgi:hypothetical protein
MKRDIGSFVVRVGAALVISGCLAFAPVYAQIGDISKPGYGTPVKPPPPMPKPTPTPRTRDGHPDLSGVWFIGTSGTVDLTAANDISQRRFDPKVTPQAPPSFQPWVALKLKRIGPQDQAEPCLTCEPLGVPGFVIKNPYPIQIIQTDKQLIMLAELDATYRTIWIDGRQHPKDPDPKFNGDSVGHWEGDTLVVDTVAIDTHTWLTGPGGNIIWFPSDVMHVTERMWRPDSNTWMYQVTVDDPKVLTKSWTSAPNHYSIGQVPMGEYYCTNNVDAGLVNPAGKKLPYISADGLDERYFDEDEYQELLKEAGQKK